MVVSGVSNLTNTQTQTTFTFVGRFNDKNINQVFKIDYTPGGGSATSYFAQFKKIKSLYYDNTPSQSCPRIQPNSGLITVALCQTANIPISFNNVKWWTFGEGVDFCWGTITSYEYQLPSGWSLNGQSSTGSNWIAGSNNVTITSDLSTGGVIGIRPGNSCSSGMNNGQTPVQIPINRPSGFAVSPANVSIACGSTAPIAFTVDNLNNVTGISNYTWNLGSASNGWLYNGNPAPQTISTGTTNTLTLTPICGVTQSNVSASVTVNGTTCNASASIVTLAAPSMNITGNTSFCSGSSVYTLNNVPCNASVTWSAAPSDIVSLSPSGNSVTATQIGDGIVTLTATINACNNFAVSQSIAVGVPDRPKLLDEMDEEITTVSTCTDVHKWICPTVDYRWNILEWEWEKVVGDFNLLDYESCAQVLGFQPSSGFISVRVRNACGWSNPTFIVVKVTDCSMTMQQKSIKLFPNPASSSVTLSVDNLKQNQPNAKGKENVPAASINEVKIYDNFGSVKLYRKFTKQQTATLDVSRLQKGVYMVEVNTDTGVEYKQLIIQK